MTIGRPALSKAPFALDISFDYIQSIRLAEALLEAGGELHIERSSAAKFARLRDVFGTDPRFGTRGIPILPHVAIDHASPKTTIGKIVRPLIFPTYGFDYLRSRWRSTRRRHITFAGLLTASRVRRLNEWLASYDSGAAPLEELSGRRRLQTKLLGRLGFDSTRTIERSSVLFCSSNRGRRFPIKAWDSEYFELLLDSEFVLCPSGDYVWSYRFLEAAMCGAIPIVEERCDLFVGFRFRSMDEALDGMRWSREDAEANFELALERITVPKNELSSEIRGLLHSGALARA